MSSNLEMLFKVNQNFLANAGKPCKKFYRKPQLHKLGDLRTQTLGASPGTPDSGGGSVMEGDGTGTGLKAIPRGYPNPGDFPQPDNPLKP